MNWKLLTGAGMLAGLIAMWWLALALTMGWIPATCMVLGPIVLIGTVIIGVWLLLEGLQERDRRKEKP